MPTSQGVENNGFFNDISETCIVKREKRHQEITWDERYSKLNERERHMHLRLCLKTNIRRRKREKTTVLTDEKIISRKEKSKVIVKITTTVYEYTKTYIRFFSTLIESKN